MAVTFRPDRFGVQVVHRYTSQTGRWILFLGVHYNGVHQCWDVGAYRTHMGACQRLHFKDKAEAMFKYDEAREKLKQLKQHEEPADHVHVLGPDSDKPS